MGTNKNGYTYHPLHCDYVKTVQSNLQTQVRRKKRQYPPSPASSAGVSALGTVQ